MKILGQEAIINGASKTGQEGVESNHWAVELADFKAKFRKQRQELYVLGHYLRLNVINVHFQGRED